MLIASVWQEAFEVGYCVMESASVVETSVVQVCLQYLISFGAKQSSS